MIKVDWKDKNGELFEVGKMAIGDGSQHEREIIGFLKINGVREVALGCSESWKFSAVLIPTDKVVVVRPDTLWQIQQDMSEYKCKYAREHLEPRCGAAGGCQKCSQAYAAHFVHRMAEIMERKLEEARSEHE